MRQIPGIAKEQFMNIGLKQISLSLLFILATAEAFADPGGSRRDDREIMHAFQLQRVAVDRGEQRNEPRIAAPDERRRGAEYGRQDTSGFENRGDNNANDNSKKQGRMSPEERRALRRQIDEAGHDIYRPKR
jgi:hypothetical protein